MKMVIPDRYKDGLIKITEFSQEKWEKFVAAIADIEPSLELDSDATHALISERLGIEADVAAKIVNALFFLCLFFYRHQHGRSTEEFLNDITESFADLIEKEGEDPSKSSIFREHFSRILASEIPIGVSAKGISLLYDEERVYTRAKVVSDIRPIFLSDPERMPPTALIVHTLMLHYMENGEEKTIFMALDSKDLDELERAVERARKKEETLRAYLSQGSVALLGGQ